jgi:hypothetical protein
MRRLTEAVVAALVLVPAAAAEAGPRGPKYVYITVASHYGEGSITAPVRQGPSGRLEVRLPHGTWVECGQSCHYTLRRETVDFWRQDDRGRPGGGGDGPGYLHFEF